MQRTGECFDIDMQHVVLICKACWDAPLLVRFELIDSQWPNPIPLLAAKYSQNLYV